MKKKKSKLTPDEQVQELREKARAALARWARLKEVGGSDPTYPDGLNMNLIRNHFRNYKTGIKDICADNGLHLPEEAYLPDLPYIDANYFAQPDSERARQIKGSHRPIYNHETPDVNEYDDTQLTML